MGCGGWGGEFPFYLHCYILEEKINGQNHKYVAVAPYEVCRDIAHFEKMFQDILDKGGEGVILRDPKCPYQSGRSSGYLKHKVFHLVLYLLVSQLTILVNYEKKYRDAEARIVKSLSPLTWECEM